MVQELLACFQFLLQMLPAGNAGPGSPGGRRRQSHPPTAPSGAEAPPAPRAGLYKAPGRGGSPRLAETRSCAAPRLCCPAPGWSSAMAQGGDGGGGDGPLAGLWSAFFAALMAAFIAWMWYGGGGSGAEKEEKEEAAAAATPTAQDGSPQLRRPRGDPQQGARGEEPPQGSYKCLASATKPNDVSACREPAWNPLASVGEHGAPSVTMESPETQPAVKEHLTPLMNFKEHPRNEISDFPATASEPPQVQERETHAMGTSTKAGAPSDKHEERCNEQLRHNYVDHDEWEIIPDHSAWGDAARNSSVEDATSSKDLEQARRVVAVSPMPQTVHMTFRVHYITYSEAQFIAVTGDHECLGQWHHYVPLRCDKDGFWSDSVILPVDTKVEWKFIVVENGKVRRWEECDNRTLVTEREDRVVHKWWGYH